MTGERYLVGLIGAGIGTSMSPALHEREADRHGLRYLYEIIDLDTLGRQPDALDEINDRGAPGRQPDAPGEISTLGRHPDVLGELVTAARRLGFRGLNITHPCKQEVVKYLDDLAPEAAEMGAVNTVVFDGGRAIGHNTDRYGFAAGLARQLPDIATGHVVLLGAGGAGSAVASALAGAGVRRLTVADVDLDRARRLARGFDGHAITPDAVAGPLREADGLVNATPIGMEGHPGSPIDPSLLRADQWVADVIYRPLDTPLIRAARDRGCRVADGGGMVAFQAAASFRLFTGRAPDEDRMYRDFLELSRDKT